MSLKAAIADAASLPRRFRSPLPERTAVDRAVAKLPSPTFDSDMDYGESDDDFLARMRTLRAADRFAAVSTRDLSRLLDLGWRDPGDAELLTHALARAEQGASRRPKRALVASYLRRFPKTHPAFPLAIRALAAIRSDQDETWRVATEWRLFEPEVGPQMVARAALVRSVDEVLSHTGLVGEPAIGRYGQAVFRAACEIVAEAPSDSGESAVRSLLRLRTSLQDFPAERAFFARALLRPWRGAKPAKELREQLRTLLTDRSLLGDPRLDPTRWKGVVAELREAFPQEDAAELLQVLRSWLVQSTVRQFLAVVDTTAKSDIWPYRKAFWTAYLDHELIDDAWVVFGSKAAAVAQALDQGANKTLGFGRLGPGGSPAHSVLVLQIGDLMIGEWSHHGACRFWTRRSRYRPKMHQPVYEVEPLRTVDWSAGDQALAHHGSDIYGWQERFRAHIANETGIRERFANGQEWRPR